MSIIGYNNVNKHTVNATLDSVDAVIKKAGMFGGKVFGGFVRGTVVPRLKDPYCNINFKDIDVWFASSQSAELFIKYMGDSFKFHLGCPTTADYPFDRKQYHLYEFGSCIAWFDIIISEKLPVDDFNVNTLLYYYENVGSVAKLNSPVGDADKLINLIHNKRMVILPTYLNKLNTSPSHIIRVNRLLKNWNIETEYGLIFPEHITQSLIKTIIDGMYYQKTIHRLFFENNTITTPANTTSTNKTAELLEKLRNAEAETKRAVEILKIDEAQVKRAVEKLRNAEVEAECAVEVLKSSEIGVKQATEKRNKVFYECTNDVTLFNNNFVQDLITYCPDICNKLIKHMISNSHAT